jgi:hypothetical protein
MRALILPFLLLIALSFNVTISAMAQVSRACPCRSLLGVSETRFDMRDLLDLETQVWKRSFGLTCRHVTTWNRWQSASTGLLRMLAYRHGALTGLRMEVAMDELQEKIENEVHPFSRVA